MRREEETKCTRGAVARFVFGPSFDLFHADESGVALAFSVSLLPSTWSAGSRLLLWAGRFLSVPPRVYSGIETLLVRSTRPCIPSAPVTRSGTRSAHVPSFVLLGRSARLNWNTKRKRLATSSGGTPSSVSVVRGAGKPRCAALPRV